MVAVAVAVAVATAAVAWAVAVTWVVAVSTEADSAGAMVATWVVDTMGVEGTVTGVTTRVSSASADLAWDTVSVMADGYPGYGYGYPGYGLGYDYGYGSYPGYSYGSGYYYPGYTYGTGYVDPGSSYLVNSYSSSGYVAAPSSGYTYSSAYGTVPLQATTPAAPSSFPLPSLGIDEKGVSDATGSHIQVTRVHPGSPAERAGLKVGDTITSANGYLTQQAGNLAWIINHHAPNGVVTLNIRKAANGQDATVNATLH